MATDNQSSPNELSLFVQFANQHLESGGPNVSPEEMVQRWRAMTEPNYTLTAKDIEDAIAEIEAGGGKSPSAVLQDIRKSLGLTP